MVHNTCIEVNNTTVSYFHNGAWFVKSKVLIFVD